MSTEEKDIKIIDLNLFSGSSDIFRSAVGGYWKINSFEEGDTISFFEFYDDDIFYDASPYLSEIIRTEEDDLITTVSDDTILPTQKYPVRVIGVNDSVYSDKFWEVYWTGGTFGAETYEGIHSENIYDDYWFETALPYSKLEVNNLGDEIEVTNEIEISYDYNFYLKDYQNYVKTLDSELLIPNIYLTTMLNNGGTISDAIDMDGLLQEDDWQEERAFDSTILKFVSLEGTYPEDESDDLSTITSDRLYLVDLIDAGKPVTGRGTGRIHTLVDTDTVALYDLNLHQYLTSSVPLTPLSSSTTEYVKNALQNVMFDQEAIGGSALYDTLIWTKELSSNTLFPYYVKINFTPRTHSEMLSVNEDSGIFESPDTPVLFAESLINNRYSSKFLKSLKEAFSDEVDAITSTTEEYVMAQEYYSSEKNLLTQVKTAENTSFRIVDYFDLWKYSYENYESMTDNCYFVGEKSISRVAAMDTTGTYRYINSSSSLGVLRDTLRYLTDDGAGPVTGPDPFEDDIDMEDLLNGWSSSGKYNETIAYRIEKIGGPGTGDFKTQNVLQNFWIFNSTNLVDTVSLFDTQIKYGEEYTYNVYKYVIVAGVKYGFSDLVLSKTTSKVTETDADTGEETTTYYLEFYDPATGEITESLYDSSEGTTTSGEYNYLADFNVALQPTIKIFEIPVYSKTLKILDHPPNGLNLNPFFFVDDSQIIGFTADYDEFFEQEYPTTISSADETLKEEYLNANDMSEDHDLTLESRSQQRQLQIYRLSEMPTAYTDFENNLISTIDLLLEDSIYTLSNTIFYDKIRTNQKYYYFFRILNENEMPGQISEIYEAELINDGGYTYGVFDLVFAEDLEVDNFTNPSIVFKKLIQLQPNMSQIDFDDEGINYEDTAENQLINMKLGTSEDLIWDKTFKIRLTSKKTGKKIDLNVTYKYEHDSN